MKQAQEKELNCYDCDYAVFGGDYLACSKLKIYPVGMDAGREKNCPLRKDIEMLLQKE